MEFNRIIKLLRKERGITQKQAAEDLGVSQALLSHYEKGIRECGLDFVVRVADYYNVSCDYLLGRSAERNGMMLSAEDLPNPDKMKDNIYHGSVLPTMNKKLISNSLNVLYAKIGRVPQQGPDHRGERLPDDGRGQDVPPALLGRAAQRPQHVQRGRPPLARLLRCRDAHGRSQCGGPAGRTRMLNGGEGVKDPSCLAMTTESLTREFPLYTPSLLNLVKTSETHVQGRLPTKE